MADNETTGTGKAVATDKVTYSGDADQNVQLVRFVQTTGSEGSKTVVDLPGDATNGLDVDVTRFDVYKLTADGNLQTAVSATGNGNSLTVTGYGSVLFQVSGTFVATISPEVSRDAGSTWTAVSALTIGAAVPDLITSITTTGLYRVVVSGFDLFRARVTWTSGTSVTVIARATNAPFVARVMQQIGNAAHDAVDGGAPIKIGAKAINHGTNPTSVAANDRTDNYASRAGVPWVIGGHPNIVTVKHTTITTAVTNAAIVAAAANVRIVVTRLTVTLDNASTVFPTVLIGFHATTTPTTTGVLHSHGGFPAGGQATVGDGSGIVGIGGVADALLITTTGNATGNGLQVTVSYYTVNEA